MLFNRRNPNLVFIQCHVRKENRRMLRMYHLRDNDMFGVRCVRSILTSIHTIFFLMKTG